MCDVACNNSQCNWDGSDCKEVADLMFDHVEFLARHVLNNTRRVGEQMISAFQSLAEYIQPFQEHP